MQSDHTTAARPARAHGAGRVRRLIVLSSAVLATTVGGLVISTPSAHADSIVAGAVSDVAIGASEPEDIAAGPDGNLWFTNAGNDSVGRITPAGAISRFSGTGISQPNGIAAGPDGNVWFANEGNNSIGRITPAGSVTNFTGGSVAAPRRITAGPDGNLWFTNHDNNSIGRITPAGAITNHTTAGLIGPTGITAGPDGNLWFTDDNNSIGRITPAGAITIFGGTTMGPGPGITTGPDGNLWFTGAVAIGRITPAGVITNFIDAAHVNGARGIVTGPDGNLWFTNNATRPTPPPSGVPSPIGGIGRITTAGVQLSAFPSPKAAVEMPSGDHRQGSLTRGPDGNLWFTDAFTSSIGRITPAGIVTEFGGIDQPTDITLGADGNLWFTNSRNSSLGRLTGSGALGNFPVSDNTVTPVDSHPGALTVGPDHNLWFTNDNIGSLGRMTSAGAATMVPGVGQHPQHIATGPDGNLWVANLFDASISKVTVAGVRTRYRLPTNDSVQGIAAGPDGNVWFTGASSNSIYRVTPDGTITPFTDSDISGPTGIASGPDGNLWFTSRTNDSIGRISPAGAITVFAGAGISQPGDITAAPDGNLWFTNTGNNSIGRISTGAVEPAGTVTDFTGPTIDGPGGISAGPDGRVYFTNAGANTIGVVNTGPGAPTGVRALAGNAQAQVSWSAPARSGGSPVTGYVVFATPGNRTCITTGSTSCIVPRLTNGVSYTFRVLAVNLVGHSPLSTPSNVVTPDAATGPASFFHPLTPTRIQDSRPTTQVGPYSTRWGAGETRPVKVAGVGGVPADATAVVLNVTASETDAVSFLTIWSGGGSRPIVSSVNWSAGQIIPNQVTAKVGQDGNVEVFNNAGLTNVIVDVAGYYDASATDGFTALPPVRVLDSRPGGPQAGPYATPWAGTETRPVQVAGIGGVPADADAVVLNVTVTDADAVSHLTIWPGTGPQPIASNLNWATGTTIANAVTAKVGPGGTVSVFNEVGHADVIIDVAGFFRPGDGEAFHPLNPARIQDSRFGMQVGPYGSPWTDGETRPVHATGTGSVPADADSVVINATATNTTAASFLTVHPTGSSRSLTSSLNWAAGVTIANAMTAKVGTGGNLDVFNAGGTVDVVMDVAGYYR